MKDYKFDYDKNSFKMVKNSKGTTYYFKINNKYIEVNESVYKVCKASYDKIRYTHIIEVAESVMYYENMDLATFFMCSNFNNEIDKVHTHILYERALIEISKLPKKDKEIAELSFIQDFSDYEIAKILDIPRTTITSRKNKIRKKLQKTLKKFV